MRLSAAVLATTLLATAAGAREVGFPLLVDHALLRASLARQLGEERDGSALVWGTRGSCRSLVLSDLRVGPAPGRVRITAQVTAHLGFRFLGFCFAPLSWKGNVESVARPESGGDWRLRLRELDSHLYDTAWRRTMVASRLWDVVKGRLESELATFAFDLAPPVEEVRGLIRASVEPARARPVLEALATLRPLGVDVDDEGVKVQVALDLPPEDATPSPPEPPLAPIEVARWQQLLESWDGFLVFVVKNLGFGGSRACSTRATPAIRSRTRRRRTRCCASSSTFTSRPRARAPRRPRPRANRGGSARAPPARRRRRTSWARSRAGSIAGCPGRTSDPPIVTRSRGCSRSSPSRPPAQARWTARSRTSTACRSRPSP